MTPADAVRLIAIIRAHCPAQQFDRDTPPVWAEILHRVKLSDALLAVRELGGTTEFISTDDIAREVKRIRSERIERHPPLVPPAGLSQLEETAWLKAARTVIADGGTVPDGDRGGELKQRPPLVALTRGLPTD